MKSISTGSEIPGSGSAHYLAVMSSGTATLEILKPGTVSTWIPFKTISATEHEMLVREPNSTYRVTLSGDAEFFI